MSKRIRGLLYKFLSVGVIYIVLGVLLWSLVGCESTPPPPPPPSKVEKKQPPPPTEKPQEEAVEVEPTPVYQYDPTGRREPFKSLLQAEIEPEVDPVIAPLLEEEATPLQKFDVKQLQLTGIILGGLGDYARVRAPDGKNYTINVGTLVGRYEGKVISITDNVVLVKETIRYQSGKVEEVETPLYLIPLEEGG